MFSPKTERIKVISLEEKNQKVVDEISRLFIGNVNFYIDYANVRPWANYLKWHIDLKRLKQFLSSFDNIKSINIYVGLLEGDDLSEKMISDIKKLGYNLRTKAVKIMRFSIDATSINQISLDLLDKFVKSCLLRKYNSETIKYLNLKFKEFNAKGEYYIEDRKCNFDVEIGRDIFLDTEKGNTDTFVLWSGDSDFVDPLSYLLKKGKRGIVFATSSKICSEFHNLRKFGLIIFDIRKIKDFICWKREIKISS